MHEIITLINQSPATFFVFLFLFGACVGSFINVVALRLPPQLFYQWKQQCLEFVSDQNTNNITIEDEQPATLCFPGSRCPSCLTSLRFYHNIPIAGYVFLLGKCAFCDQPISIRYPIIELLAALMAVYLGRVYGIGWELVLAMMFSYALLVLSLIDIDHQLLPDNIVLPLLWIGLIGNSFSYFTDLQSAVFGAVAGYMVLWLIYQAHHKLTGKEGMGYGDFKLLAAIGAWLGWQTLPVVILLASISGTLFAVFFMITRKQGKDVPISFGPYLALSAWVAMLWGDTIMDNYLKLFRL